MKKNVFGRKLKRDKNERKALFKSLMSALVLNERIQTSEAKAKAIRPEIERLVTKAKKGGNAAKLVIEKSLSKAAFDKLVNQIGPRFAKRVGGYTRIIKIGERFGDNSPLVLIEWTETQIENSSVRQAQDKIQNEEGRKSVKKTESKKEQKAAKKTARKVETKSKKR